MSGSNGPILPSRDGGGASGCSTATLPPRETAAAVQRPADEVPRTCADRIRLTTANGGLTALPASFDDADGDWKIIHSASYFDRLYLDAAQWTAITPEMVRRNQSVIGAFWNEKIAAMQSGSARTQILMKFGGPYRSEEMVRSYPRELKRAADRLLTPDGIARYREELDIERRAAAEKVVQPLLDFIIADQSVEPAETDNFFTHATAAGLSLDEAASLLDETIRARDFRAVGVTEGATLPQRLRSVRWVSPTVASELARAAVAADVAPVATPAVVAPLPQRTSRTPTLVLALSLIAIAAIAAIVNVRQQSPPRQQPVTVTIAATPAPVTPPPVPAAPPEAAEASAAAVSAPVSMPVADTSAAEIERLQRDKERLEASQRDAAARAEATRLDQQVRAQQEAQRLAALRDEVVRATARANDLMTAGDLANARQLLEQTRSKLAADAASLISEVVDIDRLSRVLETKQQRVTALRSRAAEAESMNGETRYPEAISIANRLLKEPDLPSDVSDRAQKALAFAEGEMRKLVSPNDLKNVRTKRTKGESK